MPQDRSTLVVPSITVAASNKWQSHGRRERLSVLRTRRSEPRPTLSVEPEQPPSQAPRRLIAVTQIGGGSIGEGGQRHIAPGDCPTSDTVGVRHATVVLPTNMSYTPAATPPVPRATSCWRAAYRTPSTADRRGRSGRWRRACAQHKCVCFCCTGGVATHRLHR